MAGSAGAGEADPQAAAPADAPYTVVDGNKVDPKTLDGWKTWRALACERCHGAEQEGLVGPSLVEKLKTLKKEEFHDADVQRADPRRACHRSAAAPW